MPPNGYECALVVDDDPIVLEVASCFLAARGVREVIRAANGAAALDAIAHRGRDIQLILCDLQMPELDGLAFLRCLSAEKYTGAVIIVSSMGDAVISLASRLAKSHGLDVLGTLRKPLNCTRLYTLLDQAVVRAAVAPDNTGPHPEIDEASLRAGLGGREMVVYYQPKIEIATGQIVGAEALARWKRPDGSLVSPDRFVPLAERIGLITSLDSYIMADAIADLPRLQAVDASFRISVNASADTLGDVMLFDSLVGRLAEHKVDAGALTLEITESQALRKTTSLMEVLGRLRLAGFSLAIDDFGTGHSNLETLREFPFTELKIDRSFVKDALSCPRASASVESCLFLGRELGMTVVAEGVESEEHWDFLEKNGTSTAQGYFIAKPMAVNDLLAWLRARDKLQPLLSRPDSHAAVA